MTQKVEQWAAAYRRSVGRIRKLESWPDTANKAQLIFKAGWDAALASHAPSEAAAQPKTKVEVWQKAAELGEI